MSWLQTLAFIPRPPDPRPMRVVEQEILDELEFHIEMRTHDNQSAGMSASEARWNAIERFGDFERIHRACRCTLLGERIMLQRVQAVLTLVLLGAVIFLGIEFYRGQRANEAATARIAEMLEQAAKRPVTAVLPAAAPPAAKVHPGNPEFRTGGSDDDIAIPTVTVPPEDLKYRTTGSDEDVKTLIARALKANSPWIQPKPVRATYSLVREDGETKERTGPFSIQKDCKRAVRVGSILWTPLHSMARKNTPYTARMVGKAEWKGKSLVAVDVTFDPPVPCGIGLGGQEGTTYSSCDFSTATARIVFESTSAIPLVIACSSKAAPATVPFNFCWVFDSDFFAVDGAFAPSTLYWDGPSAFRERQEFQVVNGIWIFKQGDAWKPPASLYDEARHIQRVRLVDLFVATVASKDRPKVVSVSPAPNASGIDPVTEIRIRFDRPMDPDKLGLYGNPMNNPTPFRSRRSPKYLAVTNEFVVPVILKPGARYDFSLVSFNGYNYLGNEKVSDFRSIDGVAAEAYSWRFATRDAPANPKAAKPRVVSIDPPSGAKTGMVTAIHVRFDQPMNPEAYEPIGSIEDKGMGGREVVVVPFPVEYDASSHCFTFLAFFPCATTPRIELRGFRSADGGEAEPVKVKYEVGKKLYLPEQEARIVEAGRSAKLREVVDAVRRNRLALKSLETTVRIVSPWASRHLGWWNSVGVDYACFGFQGERQFYADVSSIMEYSPSTIIPPRIFRLGSDGRECWFLHVFNHANENSSYKQMFFCPFDATRDRTVIIGDPFGSKRFASTEKAIQEMKLEYLGDVTREGKTCYRVRSWEGRILTNSAYAVRDWLIDAKSLLPAVCENSYPSYEFSYARVNEPIPAKTFHVPAASGVSLEPFKLEEGYDHFFIQACDGSNGRMSARWGQQGSKGSSSSGLN